MARFQSSCVDCSAASKDDSTASRNRRSKKGRRIRKPSVISWPGFVPHPERYIIHRKFGLIQLMRSKLKSGPPNCPCAIAWRPVDSR